MRTISIPGCGIYLFVLAAILACCNVDRRETRAPTDAEIEQYNASVAPEERIVCREATPDSNGVGQRVCRRAGDF